MSPRGFSSLQLVAVAWLVTLGGAALLADVLPLADPTQMALTERNELPSRRHLLGTDSFGRDLLSRTVYGSRASLMTGLLCPLAGLLLGGIAGTVAGYRRGLADRMATLAADTLLALPALLVALLFAALLGGSLTTVMLSLGLLTTPVFLRVARAQAMSVTVRPYVQAAQSLGASGLWILHRHIARNVWPALANLYLLVAAVVVVLEGALSYLGLGVSPPAPSLGGMIADGRGALETHPHVALLPALVLMLTVLALNAFGDAASRVTDGVRRVPVRA